MIENIKIVVPTLNTYLILPRLINSLKDKPGLIEFTFC